MRNFILSHYFFEISYGFVFLDFKIYICSANNPNASVTFKRSLFFEIKDSLERLIIAEKTFYDHLTPIERLPSILSA